MNDRGVLLLGPNTSSSSLASSLGRRKDDLLIGPTSALRPPAPVIVAGEGGVIGSSHELEDLLKESEGVPLDQKLSDLPLALGVQRSSCTIEATGKGGVRGVLIVSNDDVEACDWWPRLGVV